MQKKHLVQSLPKALMVALLLLPLVGLLLARGAEAQEVLSPIITYQSHYEDTGISAAANDSLAKLRLDPAEVARNTVQLEEEMLVADNDYRKIEFTAEGVGFALRKDGELISEHQLTYHLREVRSGQHIYAVRGEVPVAEENQVSYPHSMGVTERYIVDDRSLEQLFELDDPLPLDGDLEIVVQFDTELTPVLDDRFKGVSFYDGTTNVLHYSGAVVFDAVGREAAVPLSLAGYDVIISVPEEWLADATYPVTIDPRLEGSPINIATSMDNENNPSVAYSTASGQYLVVFESDTGSGDVLGRYVDGQTGETVSETLIIATIFGEANPDVVYDSSQDRFLVVFEEIIYAPENTYHNISGVLLKGSYQEGDYFAGEFFTIASNNTAQPAVAFNEDDNVFQVVFLRGDEDNGYLSIYGQMLSSDNTTPNLLGQNFEIQSYYPNPIQTPDVAWSGAGNTFLAVWVAKNLPEYSDLIMIRYLHDTYQGGPTQVIGNEFLIAPWNRGDNPLTYDTSNPAVAYDPVADAYVVVFEHKEGDYSSAPHTIHGQRVRPDYNAEDFRYDDNYAFPIETTLDNTNDYHYSPAITFSGLNDEMHIVYQTADIEMSPNANYFWIYDRTLNGTSVGSRLEVRAAPSNKVARVPDVACSDGRCLVVWEDEYSDSDWDIKGQRVWPDPDIEVNPTSMSVTVSEGYSSTQTLTIANVGTGTLNWNLSTNANNGVVGEWTLSYDWGCDGDPGSLIWTFYEDFTFTSSSGSSGTWVLSGNEIVVTFTSGTEYTGTVDGDSMTGTMISGDFTGCWSAERVTGMSGYVTLQSGQYTDSGDRAEEPGATTEYFVNPSDWLTANPTSGTEAAGASTDVTVGLDATNLTAGMYSDTLTITSNDPDEATVEVPVQLTVVEANEPAVIYDVRSSNVRDVSFTVSWLTDVESNGEVHYGTDPNNLNQTAYDTRGNSMSDDTHYVSVQNLIPNTTYYFDVVSGSTTDDHGGSHYSVTTGPTLGVPGTDTVFGQVTKSAPAAGSIVYITLSDRNGSGTSGEAALLSALVDNDGNWNSNLGNARTEDLSAYFLYSANGGDQLFLEAQGAADGEGCQNVDTSADTPAATIELGNSPCLISADIDLTLGWNKIAQPINANPMTASEVCDQISSQGGNIAEIDRWNAGGWQGHVCGQPFNNFTLEMNTGYFIRANQVSTWGIEGLPVMSTTLELQIGWNSISVPHTDGYMALELCDDIINQGVTAVEIDRWDAGGWEGHVCGQGFNNFNIERGKGYFIKATSAGTITLNAPASRQSTRQATPVQLHEVQAGPIQPIRDLRVSNLRDTSVTLSWTTDEPTTGYVLYGEGENPELAEVAVDVRGANILAHYVRLTGLKPETSYDLKVVSGAPSDHDTVLTITTGPTLESVPTSDTIYGQVYMADGLTPATDVLVYLTLQDADGLGDTAQASLMSARVDENGYWHANLGNARLADGTLFDYSANGDELLIEVQGVGRLTQTLTSAAPAPDIILSDANVPTSITVGALESTLPLRSWPALLPLALVMLAGTLLVWRRRKK